MAAGARCGAWRARVPPSPCGYHCGATMTAQAPIGRAPDIPRPTPSIPLDPIRRVTSVTRVLVVEDEESFSDAISYMLRKEGFEVAVCPTGPDALETFDRSGEDLVLLDLMLPGLPGSEVCRSLRERSSVPVIMLTAKDSEIDKVVGLELGADDYVTKPFSSRELVARIRAVLRRHGQAEEPEDAALEAGPVRMDVERHTVSVSGRGVQLPL